MAVAWAVSSIRDSLLGWLNGADAARQHGGCHLEQARKTMIELLLYEAPNIDEAQHLHLLQRLRYAPDMDSLWYLRPELVSALAHQMGELQAQDRVRGLSHLFADRSLTTFRSGLVDR